MNTRRARRWAPLTVRRLTLYAGIGTSLACAHASSATHEVARETVRSRSTRNDTVYVAYGAQLRRDVTSAITALRIDERDTRGNRRVQELLIGRVPGLEVRGDGTVLLRGREPLIVVDGVALPLSMRSRDALNDLDPRDIARIDVLRDAGAAAAYGMRGGNGVVLITLKRR